MIVRGLIVLAAAAISGAAVGQVQVVESEAVQVGGTAPSSSTAKGDYGVAPESTSARPASPSGGAAPAATPTAELFHQLQLLQIEVQELRGQVEEQAHLINRLTREQKNQYLDLDRRIALLSSGGRGAPASTPAASGTSDAAAPAAGVSPSATRASGTGTERDAYSAAFNLTKDKRFQDAIDAFNQLIVDYPNGQFTANAFYWLGELYLALPEPELEKSRQSFAQVVNLYPSHQKVPDSLYKLGVVYYRLGESDRAMTYLDRVQSEYPTSPAARLAKSYAAELR